MKPVYPLIASVMLLYAGAASAMFVVDTGPGPGGVAGGLGIRNDELGVQFAAAQFTTSQDWIVTGVEGWISRAGDGETGTIALYLSIDDLPGTELFASAYTARNDDVAEWEGTQDLAWLLPAGTYFASFEIRAGQTMAATMVNGAEDPLDLHVFFNIANGAWQPVGNTMGVRVSARPLPLPAAFPLMGTALGLLATLTCRRRSAPVR